jgi:hypothetical protein
MWSGLSRNEAASLSERVRHISGGGNIDVIPLTMAGNSLATDLTASLTNGKWRAEVGFATPDMYIKDGIVLSPNNETTRAIQSAIDATTRLHPTAETLTSRQRATIVLIIGAKPVPGELPADQLAEIQDLGRQLQVLSSDIFQLLSDRQREKKFLPQIASGPNAMLQQWNQSKDFDDETASLFLTRYGTEEAQYLG